MSADAPAPGMVRDLGHVAGARFFREGEDLFFAYVMDASSILGPRPATTKDQEDHPAAWAEFCAREDIDPLDRDARGGAGGSLKRPTGSSVEIVIPSSGVAGGGGSLQGPAGAKAPRKVKNEPAHDHSAGN